MILSDTDILRAMKDGDLLISPFCTEQLQPSSVDLTLDRHFKLMEANGSSHRLDPYEPLPDDVFFDVVVPEGDYFLLRPHTFALASTVERISLSPRLAGTMAGKSSIARLGVVIEAAGFFDPGFDGTGTLELANYGALPIKLWPGMRIAQMTFSPLSSPSKYPYGSTEKGSKYVGQTGPTLSRYHLNDRPVVA